MEQKKSIVWVLCGGSFQFDTFLGSVDFEQPDRRGSRPSQLTQNICTMLDQRRRCWVDVVQMLYKRVVFAGIFSDQYFTENRSLRGRILVQVTIYRRVRIGRDGHLDQSEACDIS